jgi:hypothetical protein
MLSLMSAGKHRRQCATMSWSEKEGVGRAETMLAGCVAVFRAGPFDRCLRDILIVNQHWLATPQTCGLAGRPLLGLEPRKWLF